MSPQEAKLIIESLAKGIGPGSGEVLSGQGVFNSPEIIHALFLAVSALDGAVKSSQRKRSQPSNAGLSWSEEEDRRLLKLFDSGASIKEIAVKHERTTGAINSHLIRLGRLDARTTASVDEREFKTMRSAQAPEESLSKAQDNPARPAKNVAVASSDDATIRSEYSLFEKLMERNQEVRSFLVQIGPIPKANDLWIFGDGHSWGKLIEHNDAVKANQDSIIRVADIFCEWMRDCAEMMFDHTFDDLAHRFELKLKSNPKEIFKLFPLISRMTDIKLISLLQKFSIAGDGA